MSQEPYSFCFLRYFNEPLSGEFVNVGIVLWAPESSYLGFRFSSKFHRLSRFYHNFQSQDYRQMISRIETRFERLDRELNEDQANIPFEKPPEQVRDIATKIIPHDDGALQWSKSLGGITGSPDKELELLYEEIIARHYEESESSRRNEAHVYREVYSRAFEAPEVKPFIKKHEVIAPLAMHTFDHAWLNGAWNVYQTVSFDLKRAEDIRNKAFRWESLSRFLSDAEEKPKIHLLLGSPSERGGYQAYGRAKDILGASNVAKIIEEDEANDFAVELASQIRDAG